MLLLNCFCCLCQRDQRHSINLKGELHSKIESLHQQENSKKKKTSNRMLQICSDWKGPLEVIWSKPPTQAGSLRAGCPRLSSYVSNLSKNGDPTTSLDNFFKVFDHLHSKERGFFYVHMEFHVFWFASIASRPTSGHYWLPLPHSLTSGIYIFLHFL